MALSGGRDLTRGNAFWNLLTFTVPFLAANFLQVLYGAVDLIIIGHFGGGSIGVAAVASGCEVLHLLTSLIMGVTAGATVLIGQYYGAGDAENLRRSVGMTLSFSFLLSLVLTAVTFLLAPYAVHWIQTPEEAVAPTLRYVWICAAGLVFVVGYTALSSIFRGYGNSVAPLIFVGVACAINIALDLWLVKGLGMGAAGAAWATVIAQAVSFLLAAWYLGRSRFIFDFRLRSFRIHKDKMQMMVRLGIPSSVQSIIVNISFLVMIALVNVLSQNAMNPADYPGLSGEALRSAPAAAVGIVGKFNSFAILPAVAMSSSVSAFAAQNMGAGKLERARRGLTIGLILACAISTLVFVAVQLFPEAFIRLFDQEANAAVIESGKEYMFTFSFDYLLVPVQFCLNGLVMGAGHTRFVMLSSCLSSLLLRIPVAILFGTVLGWGLTGVGLAAPAATLAGVALTLWFVLSGRWQQNQTGIHASPEGPEDDPAAS